MNADEIKSVKEAHAQGAIIQFKHKMDANTWTHEWADIFENDPHWDFKRCDYRVSPLFAWKSMWKPLLPAETK